MKYWCLKKLINSVLVVCLLSVVWPSPIVARDDSGKFWKIQSVDTMKYSRDLAREKSKDANFDSVIDRQVREIANTGATHVAIGTPYDPEFVPFLKKWVVAARKYGLRVWFRGNFSGWEGWFEYQSISREEHLRKLRNFVESNASLFENGDIVSGCPECENGGPGDPRATGDITGFRRFLVEENKLLQDLLGRVGKRDIVLLYSMNGDVARLVMDRETTAKLGGIVTVDHYVNTPEKLVSDIEALAKESRGKVVLGEFGVPIAGIHRKMSQKERAEWVEEAMRRMVGLESLIGLNYWVNVGGSTQLWDETGRRTEAVDVLTGFYSPRTITGRVRGRFGLAVSGANIIDNMGRRTVTDNLGNFTVVSKQTTALVEITADGYEPVTMKLGEGEGSIMLKAVRGGVIIRLLELIWGIVVTRNWGRIGLAI